MWSPETCRLCIWNSRKGRQILAPTIVYFGRDNCFRLPILRSAGYTVETCDSLDQLAILASKAEVVTLGEKPEVPIREVLALTRARSRAPVILFRNDSEAAIPKGIDLLIPALTAPEDWLKQIAGLLQQSRTRRAESPVLQRLALREETTHTMPRALHQAHGAPRRESGFGLTPSHDFQCARQLRRGSIISSPWSLIL